MELARPTYAYARAIHVWPLGAWEFRREKEADTHEVTRFCSKGGWRVGTERGEVTQGSDARSVNVQANPQKKSVGACVQGEKPFGRSKTSADSKS